MPTGTPTSLPNHLRIQAYKTADCNGAVIGTFEAFVNPAEITLSYEMEYAAASGAGTTGANMSFTRAKPGDLALTFFLDGTGANGRGFTVPVQSMVDHFQTVTGYNGDIHRPNYLLVLWGTIRVRRCILKSASIAYKLFKPDGTPLRAVISAVFSDSIDDQTRVALAQDSSPDLTHVRVLNAGDTLPAMCQQIYGDPTRYLEVARANGLDGFRALPAGTRLRFPPLEK